MPDNSVPSTPIDVVRSLVFYVVFYLGTVFYVLACMIGASISEPALRAAVRGWSTYHRACARVLLGIRLRIEGEVPTDGVLVALKHESFYEAIDLPKLLPNVVPFPKAELAELPGWGWAIKRYGAVVVARDQGAKALRAMVSSARVFAAQGRPLAIFPEGTRVPAGARAPLQSGFAGVYKLIGLPVVPIAVDSGQLYHRRWKKPGVITFRIGERIPAGLPRDEVEARVLDAINALNG